MADAGVKLEETDVLSVKYSNLSKCPVFIGLGPSTPCDSHKGLQFDNPYSEAVAGALELSEDGEDVLEVLEAMDAVFR